MPRYLKDRGARMIRRAGAVSCALVAIAAGGTAIAEAQPVSRSTAVVILRFPDAPDNPSWAPTPAAARAAVFGSDKYSVLNYYRTQTYGLVNLGGKVNPAGDVFGTYDIPNPTHDPSCQFSQWSYDA